MFIWITIMGPKQVKRKECKMGGNLLLWAPYGNSELQDSLIMLRSVIILKKGDFPRLYRVGILPLYKMELEINNYRKLEGQENLKILDATIALLN